MLPMLLGNSDGGLKTIHLEYSKPVLYTLPRDGTYSKRVHWVSGNLKIGIKAFKRTLFGPSSNETRLEGDRQQRVESPERTFFGWKLSCLVVSDTKLVFSCNSGNLALKATY